MHFACAPGQSGVGAWCLSLPPSPFLSVLALPLAGWSAVPAVSCWWSSAQVGQCPPGGLTVARAASSSHCWPEPRTPSVCLVGGVVAGGDKIIQTRGLDAGGLNHRIHLPSLPCLLCTASNNFMAHLSFRREITPDPLFILTSHNPVTKQLAPGAVPPEGLPRGDPCVAVHVGPGEASPERPAGHRRQRRCERCHCPCRWDTVHCGGHDPAHGQPPGTHPRGPRGGAGAQSSP